MSFNLFSVSTVDALLTTIRNLAQTAGWSTLRDQTVSAERELIFQTVSGAYVGIRTETGINYKNLQLQAYKSYDAEASFHGQYGAVPHNQSDPAVAWAPSVPCADLPINGWISINDRRIIFVIKISSVYVIGHTGHFLPFASVADYPAPLLVGGTVDYGVKLWSDTSGGNSMFVFPAGNNSVKARVLLPSGAWRTVNYSSAYLNNGVGILPFNQIGTLGNAADGTRALFQGMLVNKEQESSVDSYTGEYLGYIDGIYATNNDNLTAQSEITVGSTVYMSFPNVYNNATYFLLEKA